MKTKCYFLLGCAIASTLSLASCSKDNEPDTVSASPKSLEFEANIDNESPKHVSISTNVDLWEIYNSADWIKADKLDDNTMSVSPIKAWAGTKESREATIRVKAGSAWDTVTVRQKAKVKDVLTISPQELSFAATETGEKTVAVATTGPGWSASKPSGDTWLSIEKAGNYLIVRVPSANTQSTDRLSFISFKGEGDADVVELAVRQAKGEVSHSLSVSPTALTFTATETTQKTLTVTTNQSSWSYSVTAGASWITATKSGNTLLVKVSQNTTADVRNASITFTAGSATPVYVAVAQEKPGPISELCFGNMPAGTYVAAGTPKYADKPGPGSWKGDVSLNCEYNYYMITNWGETGVPVFCDYKNGKIIMDSEFKYEATTSINAYFMAIVINTSSSTWMQVKDYEARYNTSTRKLDFSGTASGLPVMVGLMAIETATNKLVGVIGDAYANTVLTLSPASSQAPPKGNGALKAEAAKAQGGLVITPFEGNKTFRKANK